MHECVHMCKIYNTVYIYDIYIYIYIYIYMIYIYIHIYTYKYITSAKSWILNESHDAPLYNGLETCSTDVSSTTSVTYVDGNQPDVQIGYEYLK